MGNFAKDPTRPTNTTSLGYEATDNAFASDFRLGTDNTSVR
jgi:hypothetical protein